ncbi:MAG: hypothetical protein JOS17DRAFT_787491 [Linnemannia elongata]|nr:MAG: hypothetical protein JOS17DRAFT_787491 [Linnemannia elongata]
MVNLLCVVYSFWSGVNLTSSTQDGSDLSLTNIAYQLLLFASIVIPEFIPYFVTTLQGKPEHFAQLSAPDTRVLSYLLLARISLASI